MTTEKKSKELDNEEITESLVDIFLSQPIDKDNKNRTIGIYGDIDEENSAAIVHTLLQLHDSGKYAVPENPDDEKCDKLLTKYDPIRTIVSTHGGSAHEMFAIYDIMRMIKKDCEIETIGLGKVMSAGVVLLASGTKGKRSIGANCRIMMHPVAGGAMGDLQDIENDTKEIKLLQKLYVKALAAESKMTEKYIKNIIKKKVNIYLSAEEAVKLGIADQII